MFLEEKFFVALVIAGESEQIIFITSTSASYHHHHHYHFEYHNYCHHHYVIKTYLVTMLTLYHLLPQNCHHLHQHVRDTPAPWSFPAITGKNKKVPKRKNLSFYSIFDTGCVSGFFLPLCHIVTSEKMWVRFIQNNFLLFFCMRRTV